MPERNPSKKEIAARTATFAVGAAIAIIGAFATNSQLNHENYSRAAVYGIFTLWGAAIALISLNRGASLEFFNHYFGYHSNNNQTRETNQSTSSS